ncbi:MAG TPA: oligopeptide/dipeptide ABC transporter ATP-binding protein [Devosiaceae bacterium]|nr:oligopeptide/dipeptide ABC transporter ATP-binding protein [Devosiaceae bacterium]
MSLEPAIAESAMPLAFDPSRGRLCLDVRDLRIHFGSTSALRKSKMGIVRAVDGISFTVAEGETVGLVGESGCGKSTLGRAILRAHRPTAGIVNYRPRDSEDWIDLASADDRTLAKYRTDLRLIFQDPFTSLNPRQTVLQAIGQPLFTKGVPRPEVVERVADMMRRVGLRPEYMSRYPHAFSGGERQRIVIARALVVRPHIVVADEAVSALDVSVRAQTLNLLQELQDEFHLTYLFVSHDLSVVKLVSDYIAVMYAGRLVEFSRSEEMFHRPRHPYTAALIAAIPIPSPERRGRVRARLEGEVPDPAKPPKGCLFNPRCPFATDLCRTLEPRMRALADGRQVACHYAETIELKGIVA